MTVKPRVHFRWDKEPWNGKIETIDGISPGMTYKYTIYSNHHFLDPDLEINP